MVPRRLPLRLAALLLLILVPIAASAAGRGATEEIGPGSDFCAAANALAAGAELALRPGEYHGPCSLRRGGTAAAPLVIRAADPRRRPRIVVTGHGGNAIQVYASHIRLRGLAIGPTPRDVDGVRVYRGDDVGVEDCEFTGLGGIAVVANHASVSGLVVRRNVIQGSGATAMYFGCHNGRSCTVTDLLVERNVIQGVRAPEPEIGYGIQVKLNSRGIVRDNVVVDTKGPGIAVYGAHDPTAIIVVERNLVAESLRSSGILVAGGPAVVRNNVSLGHAQAGIDLQDYAGRRLLRGVLVIHNTLHGSLAGITAPERVGEATVAANAVHHLGDGPAWPASNGLRAAGNVACAAERCFLAPALGDFSPRPSGPLARPPGDLGAPWALPVDFLGARRASPPLAGAIERGRGAE